MSMVFLTAASLNTAGLLFTLVGVLVLFRYGMPFHVPTGGAIHIILEQVDAQEKQLERKYQIYGYLGLIAVAIGTALQIWANWQS